MRFRQLKIQVQTTDGPYGATLEFPDGLVIVWADNTMGKSTCAKAILVALGMEALLTTSQNDLPLPPAVKARIASGDKEYEVIESEVFLELENSTGQRIVVQRTIKGARDKNLITVHLGPQLTSPGGNSQTLDFFVNRAGAASREAGFHNYLAKFLGWDLPLVQTYDGAEYPLYLQCIVPYFVVEQTRGWSTVLPPLPGHFRIRDAHKRSVEFLLRMDAHSIALKRQELKLVQSKIELDWGRQVIRLEDLAENVAGQVHASPKTPVAVWPPAIPPSLVVSTEGNWINIKERISLRRTSLERLIGQEIPRVNEITQSAQNELEAEEGRVREQETLLSRLLNLHEEECDESKRVEDRLRAIDEDILRNKDVRTLRNLGARQSSVLDKGSCPVCHQSVRDSLMPLDSNQAVMTLDESIEFLVEQRRIYEVVYTNSKRAVEARGLQIRGLRESLSNLRERVRSLRRTLVSDGRLPSMAAIQSRVVLEAEIKNDEEVVQKFEKILGPFSELSDRWRLIKEEISRLPKEDMTASDKEKISAWTKILRSELQQFGFLSVPPDSVSISNDLYRPEHEGYDVVTSLQTSISASDLIRTIWSYLFGLLELSREIKTNHPGCIIFDEPRQQSTKDMSFSELLKRTSTAGQYGQQVIFFTSENFERLGKHLKGVPHTMKKFEGRVLKRIS